MSIRPIVVIALVGLSIACGQSSSPTTPSVTCVYSLAPATQAVPVAGGTFGATVDTRDRCGWTATADAPWISIAAGSSGVATGDVTYSVAINTGTLRRGTITAHAAGGNATTSVTVVQAGIE